MNAFSTIIGKGKAIFVLLALILVASLGLAAAPKPVASSRQPAAIGIAPMAPGGQSFDADNALLSPKGSALGAQQVTVVRSEKNDLSPPLRSIKPLVPTLKATTEGPENYSLPVKGVGTIVDTLVQFSPGTVPMPTPSANFDGIAFRDTYPPDPNGDVGPNHYVQWVNREFQIFTKTGVSVYGPAAGNTLWVGFGGPCETLNDGDPIVQYDTLAGRWLMSQFGVSGVGTGFYQCIAVSQTSDPTSSYYRYAFQMSPNLFNDYPKFGVWPDAYYMSIAQFSGLNYAGSSAVAFDRAKMLAGQPATYQKFDLPTTYGLLLPSDLDGNNPPPSGAPNTFVTMGPPNTLQLWKFAVNWANPQNSTFTGPQHLVVAPYNVRICDFAHRCINHPISGQWLDENSDRPMYRLAYRNYGTHESLVFNHTVSTEDVGGYAAPRWYEIRNVSGTPTIYQQGTFGPDDDTERWMGSIAMDAVGNMALAYSVTSDELFPGIRYTGRLATDPPGEMTHTEGSIKEGTGTQSGSHRWGDYTSLSVDPTDDCTFWYTNEYYTELGGLNWRTRIASFKFPNCTRYGTTTPTSTRTSTSTRTITPTRTATVPTSTRTPITANAYAELQPGGHMTVSVGSKLTLDLNVNGGSNNVVAAGHYLTFTHSILQNVVPTGTGCTLADVLVPDTTRFESVLQNEVCNGAVPCNFGDTVAPPGSIAFASAALSNPPGTGSFRVARVAFCANTAGRAVVRWQLPPSAPPDRQSEIADVNGNNVSNPALYADMIIDVVGNATATATRTGTATSVPSTATSTSTNTVANTSTATRTNTATTVPTHTASSTATNTTVPSSTRTGTSTSTSTTVPSTSTRTNTTQPTGTHTSTSTRTSTSTVTSAVTSTATGTTTAQPTYEVTVTTNETMVPATTPVAGSGCSNCIVNIALPFPYTFYDRTFTSVNLSSEGNLQFASAVTLGQNTCLPNPALNYAIMPYWDDLDANINDNMGAFTSLSGTAPNRVFAIRWYSGKIAVDTLFNYEVLLYESEPRFDIIYGTTHERGFWATIGAQKGTGESFTQYSCNTRSIMPGYRLSFNLESNPGKPGVPKPAATVPAEPGMGATSEPPACDPSKPFNYSDVTQGNPLYNTARCLVCRGVLEGYGDGTLRLDEVVTRGTLAKILATAAGYEDEPGAQKFEDVPPTSHLYASVQRLAARGLLDGYPCGGKGEACVGTEKRPYFRPNSPVIRAQLAKLVAEVAGYKRTPGEQVFEDVSPTSAFYAPIQRLAKAGMSAAGVQGFPCGGPGEPCGAQKRPYFRPLATATRGQAAQIVAATFFPGCDTATK